MKFKGSSAIALIVGSVLDCSENKRAYISTVFIGSCRAVVILWILSVGRHDCSVCYLGTRHFKDELSVRQIRTTRHANIHATAIHGCRVIYTWYKRRLWHIFCIAYLLFNVFVFIYFVFILILFFLANYLFHTMPESVAHATTIVNLSLRVSTQCVHQCASRDQ